MEFLLQLLHKTRLFLLRIEFFCLLKPIELVLSAVHFAKLQQVFLIATLRHKERGTAELPFHFEWNDYLLSVALEAFANLRNGSKEKFLVGFIQLSLIFERETLIDATVLYMYIIDESRSLCFVVNDGEYVNVRNCMANHLAFGAEILYKNVFLL